MSLNQRPKLEFWNLALLQSLAFFLPISMARAPNSIPSTPVACCYVSVHSVRVAAMPQATTAERAESVEARAEFARPLRDGRTADGRKRERREVSCRARKIIVAYVEITQSILRKRWGMTQPCSLCGNHTTLPTN